MIGSCRNREAPINEQNDLPEERARLLLLFDVQSPSTSHDLTGKNRTCVRISRCMPPAPANFLVAKMVGSNILSCDRNPKPWTWPQRENHKLYQIRLTAFDYCGKATHLSQLKERWENPCRLEENLILALIYELDYLLATQSKIGKCRIFDLSVLVLPWTSHSLTTV